MMNFEVYSLLRKCLDDGTFTGMDVFQAERACQKFAETGNSQHHDEKHDAQYPLKGRKAPAPHGNSVYSLP